MSAELVMPTLDERNEGYIPPYFDMKGGKLGETPILWEFRMAYPWDDSLAEEDTDSDQCCTCWVFAVSESAARQKVWDHFKFPGAAMPEAIATCQPVRFRNAKDDAIERSNARKADLRVCDDCDFTTEEGDVTVCPDCRGSVG